MQRGLQGCGGCRSAAAAARSALCLPRPPSGGLGDGRGQGGETAGRERLRKGGESMGILNVNEWNEEAIKDCAEALDVLMLDGYRALCLADPSARDVDAVFQALTLLLCRAIDLKRLMKGDA